MVSLRNLVIKMLHILSEQVKNTWCSFEHNIMMLQQRFDVDKPSLSIIHLLEHGKTGILEKTFYNWELKLQMKIYQLGRSFIQTFSHSNLRLMLRSLNWCYNLSKSQNNLLTNSRSPHLAFQFVVLFIVVNSSFHHFEVTSLLFKTVPSIQITTQNTRTTDYLDYFCGILNGRLETPGQVVSI